MRKIRSPLIVAGAVNSLGAPLTGTEAYTVVRNSAGNYTVRLRADAAVISATASCGANGFPAGTQASTGPISNTFTVVVYNSNTQVPTDASFSFIAVVAG